MEKTEKESLMSLHQESSSKSPEETQATFTGMFPVNLHSILAANTTQPLLPLSLFADNYCSLSAPKTEPPLFHNHNHHQDQPPQYGAVSAQTSSLIDYYSIFNHLPDLLSLDHSPYKRPRLLDHQTLASSYQLYPTPAESPPAPVVVPRGSSLARKRRQTLSDKMRCLQKLLPWEKKMDNATTLEAAHRYVRFLQAQVAALQAMPIVASDSAGSLPVLTRGVGGGTGEVEVLSTLSRSQMLQVAVNSPVAQMRMSDLGRCVFSVEQLALLNKKSVIRGPHNFLASMGLSCNLFVAQFAGSSVSRIHLGLMKIEECSAHEPILQFGGFTNLENPTNARRFENIESPTRMYQKYFGFFWQSFLINCEEL